MIMKKGEERRPVLKAIKFEKNIGIYNKNWVEILKMKNTTEINNLLVSCN